MPKTSRKLYKEANKYLVGGVNSPVRSFFGVGGNPVFIKSARGSKVFDVDGGAYIDYVGSWGALILGHAHPKVVLAAKRAIQDGSSFGAPTSNETELAKLICDAFPTIQKIRFVSSGSEAVMGALKLAKACTKRYKVIKFKECYHGWSEQDYLEAEFNNLDSVKNLVSKEIAAIIVEPVVGNSGVIPPKDGFLEGLRRICDQNGILLIFDEVITGFRIAFGGAQEKFDVLADLTCLGKIIGGGFPLAAYGGKQELMKNIAPEGSVYQAGTLSGNPVTVAAGLQTVRLLKQKGIYKELDQKTGYLCDGIGLNYSRVGSMFSFSFRNINEFQGFFWKNFKSGIYFAPAITEANFLSLSHSDKDIEETLRIGGRK